MNELADTVREKAALKSENERLKQDIEDLRETARLLQARFFGPKSERGRALAQNDQLKLFVLDEDEEVDISEDKQDTPIAPMPKKPQSTKKRGCKPLPDHLPRVDHLMDLGPGEK